MNNKMHRLSRLMKMSWDIQKQKHSTRSKALSAAWAIVSNEDITVYYLVKKLAGRRPISSQEAGQFSLFNPSTL